MLSRSIRALSTGAALLALTLAAPRLALAQPAPPVPGHEFPVSMRQAMREGRTAFETRRGFRGTVERLAENRRQLQAGTLKAAPEELTKLTAVSGLVNVPVLLGGFADVPAAPYDAADFRRLLFDGPWPTGTMREYYQEISYGLLDIGGGVHDWVNTSLDAAAVVGSTSGTWQGAAFTDAKTDQWIHEVLAASDPNIGFAAFDNDGPDGFPNSGDDDGYVDFIAMVHPLVGAESAGPGIWSHRSWLSAWPAGVYTTNDQSANGGFIMIDDYTVMPALKLGGAAISEIGVYCHEFGHAFGLPDLYDVDKKSEFSVGIGAWGLMGLGGLNTGSRPAHMCAWSKKELGWITPGVVTADLNSWPIDSSTLTPTAFKLWRNGAQFTNEYFLVEYRVPQGFDENLKAPGLLIWHIDEGQRGIGNADERRKLVDLECADQTGPDHIIDADDLDVGAFNSGDAGDPFCDGDSFDFGTSPSSRAYNEADTEVRILNITECGADAVRADLRVGVHFPNYNLCVRDCTTDTCSQPSNCDVWWASPDVYIDNNEDGIIDPPAEGIPNKLFVNVHSLGPRGAADITVDYYQAQAAAGLTWPGSAQYIGSANISIIDPNDSEAAMLLWDMPVTPPYADHWCLGAIVSNSSDGPTSGEAFWDDNVTQINVQQLYEKAGDQAPVAASEKEHLAQHAVGKRAEPITIQRTLQLCNPLWSPDCRPEIYLGTPPNFDDLVLPPGWSVDFDTGLDPIAFGDCHPLEISITAPDVHHLDQAIIPITFFCGELMGGNILEVNIDNFAPALYCDPFQVTLAPFDTDNAPFAGAIRIDWVESMVDVQGWPDRVERWRIHRGSTANFVPGAQNLLVETCIDDSPDSAGYTHFADPPLDPSEEFYKLVAVDRAGNSTVSCVKQLFDPAATDAPAPLTPRFELRQNWPNPFNPSTRIEFSLEQDADVDLSVFNARGERVRVLARGPRRAGRHTLVWDGRDGAGRAVASGSYVYRLVSEGRQGIRTMLLLK